MKTKLLGSALAAAMVAAPFAATAGGVSGGNANSDWSIYGWQNYSYEKTDTDTGTRTVKTDRIQGNAANIGFAASIDTGLSMGGQALKANFRCEQFTFHNRATGTGLCNRNSKLSLSGSFGELMVGQWLLPYNEMVAQWVDPFYDAGADSHTSIMGSFGYGSAFYNGDFNESFDTIYDTGFNRRQEEIVQYWSPNLNGFSFRLATTNRAASDSVNANGDGLDPRIWSTGIAYENTLASGDNIWFAVTYEQHDEWAALAGDGSDSDDTSWRVAGRYIHQWGNGMFTRVSAMWENLDVDWEGISKASFTGSGLGFDANGDLQFDRDAWMISGIQNFGNGFDFRFSYMKGEEWDCDTGCNDDDTDADAYNLGVFYTMPAGTELRLTYSEIDNEDNANYDFGIGSTGVGRGEKGKIWAVGMVQWF